MVGSAAVAAASDGKTENTARSSGKTNVRFQLESNKVVL